MIAKPPQPAGTAPAALQSPGVLLVDSHVHLYPCFDLAAFLNAAADRFAAAARLLGASAWTGCLLFTETARDAAFAALHKQAGGTVAPRWRCHAGEEEEALQLVRDDGAQLLLVSGWQVVTQENLEVLALGTTQRIADGAPIETVVQRCHEVGAVPVIPWGFGKWWFGRGKILRQLIEKSGNKSLLLGDNGGRPALSLRPSAFRLAQHCGIPVIPGTDPLPFASESTRAGAYSFVLPDWQPTNRPVAALKARLLSLSSPPRVLGRGESLVRFASLQVRMQLRKFQKKAAVA